MSLLASFLFAAALQAGDRWLHLRVSDDDGTRVSLNLPFSIVEKALPLVPVRALRHSRIECNGHEIKSEQIRDAIRRSATQPDVSFDEDDHRVFVTRDGGYVTITAVNPSERENVRIRIPAAIADAMANADGGEISLRRAVAALASQGNGDLLLVSGEDADVRIWIDESE